MFNKSWEHITQLGNGLPYVWRQAIPETNGDILCLGPVATDTMNFQPQ